jgi:hypothetical protein
VCRVEPLYGDVVCKQKQATGSPLILPHRIVFSQYTTKTRRNIFKLHFQNKFFYPSTAPTRCRETPPSNSPPNQPRSVYTQTPWPPAARRYLSAPGTILPVSVPQNGQSCCQNQVSNPLRCICVVYCRASVLSLPQNPHQGCRRQGCIPCQACPQGRITCQGRIPRKALPRQSRKTQGYQEVSQDQGWQEEPCQEGILLRIELSSISNVLLILPTGCTQEEVKKLSNSHPCTQ